MYLVEHDLGSRKIRNLLSQDDSRRDVEPGMKKRKQVMESWEENYEEKRYELAQTLMETEVLLSMVFLLSNWLYTNAKEKGSGSEVENGWVDLVSSISSSEDLLKARVAGFIENNRLSNCCLLVR